MTDNSDIRQDLCLICNEQMGQLGNVLTVYSRFSRKPIWQLFETFITTSLSQQIIRNRKICQNCYIKFNELDEHHTVVEKIQNELLVLYNNTLATSFDVKHDIKLEEPEVEEVNVFPANVDHLRFDSESEDVQNTRQQSNQESDDEPLVHKKRKYTKTSSRWEEKPSSDYVVIDIDGEKWYQCNLCSKSFQGKIKRHLESHTEERDFKCEICGACFKTFGTLRNHKKIHKERKYHRCDMCGTGYLQKIVLLRHMEAIHLKLKDHICPMCGKAFSRDTILKDHILTHTGQKDYVCTTCGYETYTKSKLTRHMKSHTRERNYTCELCGKRFLHSYNVITHVNEVHKGIKRNSDALPRLACKFCGKKFLKIPKYIGHLAEDHSVDKKELDKLEAELNIIEMKSHNRERNHPCELCDKSFLSRYHLNTHVDRVHKGIRPPAKLECKFCSKRFRKIAFFKDHLSSVHHIDNYEMQNSTDENPKDGG